MNKATSGIAVITLAATLALGGCKKAEQPGAGETGAALGDQIVVDPEVTGGAGEAGNVTLSPASRAPQAVAAARKSAAELSGGLAALPDAIKGSAAELAQAAAQAAQASPAARAARTDCSAKVQYSRDWAKKLPAEFPLYPQGAVQEAAGIDAEGCRLRVVSFGTAVPSEDVIAFYNTMARKGGYSAEYRLDGSDRVLGGRKQGQAYVVYARKQANGVTEVDLVVSGK